MTTLEGLDWSLFHSVNAGVAARDWFEDPTTALAVLAVPLYVLATLALWFVARPFRSTSWKPACVSALLAAGIALVANQAIAELWARPRPLAGMLVGFAAATLVVFVWRVWIDRAVTILSRVSDPLLEPVWDRITSASPVRR